MSGRSLFGKAAVQFPCVSVCPPPPIMLAMPFTASLMSLTQSPTAARGTETVSAAPAMSARPPAIHPLSGNRSGDHTAYSKSSEARSSSRICAPSSSCLKRSGTRTPMTPPTRCPVSVSASTLSKTSASKVFAGMNSVSMITGAFPSLVTKMSGRRPPRSTRPILSPRERHAWRMPLSTSAMFTFMVASAVRPRGAWLRPCPRLCPFMTPHLDRNVSDGIYASRYPFRSARREWYERLDGSKPTEKTAFRY